MGKTSVIIDAKGRELSILRTNYILVILGTYAVKCDFYDILVTKYILGSYFCGNFFNAIKPRKRLVDMYDRNLLHIIMKRKKRDAIEIEFPENLNDSEQEGRISHKGRVFKKYRSSVEATDQNDSQYDVCHLNGNQIRLIDLKYSQCCLNGWNSLFKAECGVFKILIHRKLFRVVEGI